MAALKFHLQKIHYKPKSKGQGLYLQGLHTWLCSKNDRASTERRQER